MNTYQKVHESNRIEGIGRDPLQAEIVEFERFFNLGEVTISDLVDFVGVYQPDAMFRVKEGMNVRVGSYYPPAGGPEIQDELFEIVDAANNKLWTPWEIHTEYESLHPFTDGNGRSGRMLWYWTMRKNTSLANLGFLHAFYYQTLQNYQDVM